MSQIANGITVPFANLRVQYTSIKEEVDNALTRVIERSSFILGEEVAQFEREFAAFCGADHAVGVGNGTDALVLALKALGVGPRDEVITVANTFVATVEAIAHAGACPVLADIDPTTYTIDPNQVEAAITPRTRAIIPVHLYGQPAEMDRLVEIARAHNLFLIEDASQAHGAAYRGKRVGSFGHAACFSFYPAKNLGAFGDAGAVVTNNEETALRVRKLRDHGGVARYQHDLVGHNSRLDTLQAAVLLVKLRHLERWNTLRRLHAQAYSTLLAGEPYLVTPATRAGSTHVFHLYVVALKSGNRDGLLTHLRKQGIETWIHYPTPVHLTEAFRGLGYSEGAFPVAERSTRQILSLPMFPELRDDEIVHVARAIQRFAGGASEEWR